MLSVLHLVETFRRRSKVGTIYYLIYIVPTDTVRCLLDREVIKLRVLSKITFESVYLVWKVIARVAEVVYSLVCVIDRWMYDHGNHNDV